METRQFAPGVADAFAAQGCDMSGVLPETAPKVVATFLPGKPRSERIPLEWPVEVGGVAYEAVTLRRLSTAEVGAFMESIKDAPADAKVVFPIFRDANDTEIPQSVLDCFDDDDTTTLKQAALAFLPRRFGGDPASAIIPATGASTAP